MMQSCATGSRVPIRRANLRLSRSPLGATTSTVGGQEVLAEHNIVFSLA